jgi:hypothetical protein
MKYQVIVLSFITLTLLFSSCNKTDEGNSYKSAKSVDYEYFKKIVTLKNNEIVKITGIFDLKSLCLNFNLQNKETQDICKISLAKNGEANTDNIETSLRFCNNEIRANCIEPLPDNAPPEVIQILDKNSKVIEPWSKIEVILRIIRKEQINDFEVMQIESTN